MQGIYLATAPKSTPRCPPRASADPAVGCVCGHLRYTSADGGPTAETGGLYWRLEETIKEIAAIASVDPEGVREVREYWERFWSQALAGFKAVADTEAEAEQRAGIRRKEHSDGDRG